MGKQMGNVFYSKLKIVIPNNYWDVESKKIAANKYAKKSYSRLAWIIGARVRLGIELKYGSMQIQGKLLVVIGICKIRHSVIETK